VIIPEYLTYSRIPRLFRKKFLFRNISIDPSKSFPKLSNGRSAPALIFLTRPCDGNFVLAHSRSGLPLDAFAAETRGDGSDARDIRALLQDSEFQQISDQHSERLFFKQFLAEQGLTSIHDITLVCIHQISVGNVEKPSALSAKMNNEELAYPFIRKLSLMIKKSRLSKTGFLAYLRELSLQRESS
jgi:hypothetical protein